MRAMSGEWASQGMETLVWLSIQHKGMTQEAQYRDHTPSAWPSLIQSSFHPGQPHHLPHPLLLAHPGTDHEHSTRWPSYQILFSIQRPRW